MLPFDNKNEFQVLIDFKNSTPLKESIRLSSELSNSLLKNPDVQKVQVFVGEHMGKYGVWLQVRLPLLWQRSTQSVFTVKQGQAIQPRPHAGCRAFFQPHPTLRSMGPQQPNRLA